MSESSLNDILSGGGLSSLLQNPEVAAKLPRIMEALGPVISEMRTEQTAGEKEDKSTVNNEENGQSATPALSLVKQNEKNSASHRRRALLNALEPYLSDGRREAMNSIGKILTLIDLLSEVM